MTTIYGSNTRADPGALKHFFKCQERSGQTMTDSVGGVVFDPSVIAGRSIAFNQNGSVGTVCPIGHGVNDKAIQIASGTFHTFAGNKPIVTIIAARYFTDSLLPISPDPRNDGGTRFAIGDINGIGTIDGVFYGTPGGIGLVGDHTAMGNNSAAVNTWKASFIYGDGTGLAGAGISTPGYVVEPDTANYPVDPNKSATTRWLEKIDFKFNYDAFYPYRVSPPAAMVTRDLLFVSVHDAVGGTKTYEIYDIDTGTLYLKSDSASLNSLSGTFTPNPCMRVTNLALYGYAIFEFSNGLPTDWLAAAQWMGRRWKSSPSERVVYPLWNLLT